MSVSIIRTAANYFEVLKPLPSILLAFIGLCVAFVAGGGELSAKLLLVVVTILVAAAGANGVTNYLDRKIDARMQRTMNRALPSKRIYPPHKVLPLLIGLIVIGMVLAWHLHPYAFIADLVGTLTAATWRKKVTCVYPQGVIASCAPIFMGWFAIRPTLSWEVLLFCIIIATWLPLHVWSVIIAHKEEYLQAGLDFFPISYQVREAVKILLIFSLVLYAASIALYFIGSFAWLYLVLANILGVMMVYSSIRLVLSKAADKAWKMYKLSAFPYLGVIFTFMCLDIWLLG